MLEGTLKSWLEILMSQNFYIKNIIIDAFPCCKEKKM